jgi:uncharacterized membrane-anchored protein
MNTLARLAKILAVLLIFLLLIPFVLGAAVVAPRYINLLLPIVFLVVIAFGVGLYYMSKHKRFGSA